MTSASLEMLSFIAIPFLALLLGSISALFRSPSHRFVSSIQHFAAGIVFASVAIELLPMIIQQGSRITVSLGFLIGVFAMLLIKLLTIELQKRNLTFVLPVLFLTAVAVDLLIDGLLIGIAFLANQQSGVFIALALTFEIFFLGLSTVGTMNQKGIEPLVKVVTSFLLAALIPIGALLGQGIFSWLPHYWLIEVIAFGIAALLYLVVEELLVDAHEIEDTPWVTGMFFIGFLMIVLMSMSS